MRARLGLFVVSAIVVTAGCNAGDARRVGEMRSTVSDGAAPAATVEHDFEIASATAEPDREGYEQVVENEFLNAAENPLSTFSIDVDTASYSNVRRFLSRGQRPPIDAVRIEELINYFPYDYEPPAGDEPFAVHTEVAGCPWKPENLLVRIGIKGRPIEAADRRPSNLVFLIDVSGSMNEPNKLPLVKTALGMLVEQLTENDRVAIVVYAGSVGLALPSTTGDQKQVILSAIEHLEAGGSTNGGAGIQLAYDTAIERYIAGGINRVILATDGDFNVGLTRDGDLAPFIQEKAASGVFLTVLGFGEGNLQDARMEGLADRGNGNYAYVDGPAEARKVFVEQLTGTLITIAKDVKVQLEFNPAKVAAYRLIGYENRLLAAQDFADDTKDAGEIGAGHTVTALYEVVPAGQPRDVAGEPENSTNRPFEQVAYSAGHAGGTSPPARQDRPQARGAGSLRYQTERALTEAATSDEVLTLSLRYKAPEGHESAPLKFAVVDRGAPYHSASGEFKFAAAVASFGMLLRDSPHAGGATWDAILELGQEGIGADVSGHRAQFIELVKVAREVVAKSSAP